MDKKIYRRGKAGQYWYNFTESLAYAATYRRAPKDVIYDRKVLYGSGKQQYYNTYCRKDLAECKKPLFIYIHGGGWVSGITDMRNNYIANWAELGFFTASLNYTYAPQAVYPTQIGELFEALDHIIETAYMYNIDTENTVIAAESAGVYYMMQIASLLAAPDRLDKQGITFKHIDKFNIKALVSHSGCFDLPALINPAKKQSKFPDMKMMVSSFLGMSIEKATAWLKTDEGKLAVPQLAENFPPMYVIYAEKDALKYEALDLLQKLDALGVPYGFFPCDGKISRHGMSIVTMFDDAKICLRYTEDFVLRFLPDYFEKQPDKTYKFILPVKAG